MVRKQICDSCLNAKDYDRDTDRWSCNEKRASNMKHYTNCIGYIPDERTPPESEEE